jgi:hypothetical protein
MVYGIEQLRLTLVNSVSCRFRSRMNPSLGTRLLHLRCARVIQAWWRWKLLHHRLEILKETKLRAGAASTVGCLPAGIAYVVVLGRRFRSSV